MSTKQAPCALVGGCVKSIFHRCHCLFPDQDKSEKEQPILSEEASNCTQLLCAIAGKKTFLFCNYIFIMASYQQVKQELPSNHFDSIGYKHESSIALKIALAMAGMVALIALSVWSAVDSTTYYYSHSAKAGLFPDFLFPKTNAISSSNNMSPIVFAELIKLNNTITGNVWIPQDGSNFVTAARVWRHDQGLPMAVIEVANEQDVIESVIILGNLYTTYQIPFRIRSGGHNKAGYSTVADGIVLSLKHMTQRSIVRSHHHSSSRGTKSNNTIKNESSIIVAIQPGARVEDILDTFLGDNNGDGQGYAGALGQCGKVAEGGWVLGGGVGFMTRLLGLGVDNVHEFRIVLANGSVKVCSNTENTDLFWALRGAGSGNYGVITEMKYELHSVPDQQLFKTVTIPFVDLGAFLYEMGNTPPSREFGAVIAGRDGNLAKAYLSWFSPDKKTIQKGDHFFREEIKPILPPAATVPEPYSTFLWAESTHTFFDKGYGEAVKSAEAWQGFLFPVNNTKKILHDIMAIMYEGMKISPNLEPHIELWGGAVSDVASSDTAFPYREAIYNVGVLLVIPEDSLMSPLHFHQQVAAINSWWPKVAKYLTGSYLNYPMNSLTSTEYPRLYWGDNLPRLVELKQKYDADNIFSYDQSMPWSLGK